MTDMKQSRLGFGLMRLPRKAFGTDKEYMQWQRMF